MSQSNPECYYKVCIPPLVSIEFIAEWRAASDAKYLEMSIALVQRLADHGIADGYEISHPVVQWMNVKVLAPQCMLLLG